MFAYINGKLVVKEPTCCILDVGGIGYEISISLNTFERLPDLNQNAMLRIYFHVREDIQKLFGFHDQAEKDLFLLLTGISGIGPKMALTILSGATPAQFRNKIAAGDVKSLTLIPGIGKKTAQRIVMELSEKLVLDDTVAAGSPAFSGGGQIDEALKALISLGYSAGDAQKSLGKAVNELGEKASTQQYIKAALNKF